MFVIYSIIGFIIGVGVLVFVHELGHFIMAKLSGVRVEKFSIGFPPKIFSIKYGDTEYTLGATPIGGYVKMAGMIDENMDSEIKGEPDEFMSKTTFQKSMILLGGVLFNVLFAILIMFFFNVFSGEKKILNMPIQSFHPDNILSEYIPDENILITKIGNQEFEFLSDLRDKMLKNMDTDFTIEYETQDGQLKHALIPSSLLMDSAFISQLDIVQLIPTVTTISSIAENSEAERVGLQKGDTLISLNNIPLESYAKLEKAKYKSTNSTADLVYKRDNDIDTVQVNLTADKNGRVLLGFIPSLTSKTGNLQDLVIQIDYGIFESARLAVVKSAENFVLFLKALKQIVTLKVDPSKSVGGPIEIANLFGQALETGSLEIFFRIVGSISIMLALMNVLPIPGLDGGHLLIVWVEAIRGKALSIETKMTIQKIGVTILLFIMIFAFSNDIMRRF